jgi:dipeptidyl aminopeptidase/acylaminoacyl peptidase
MSSSPKHTRPFGLWPSPVSPQSLAGQMRLSDALVLDDGVIWVEGRGKQGVAMVQRGVEAPRDLFTTQSARGGVGYGGGELAVAGEKYYFTEADGRLYAGSLEHGAPKPITPKFGSTASPAPSPDGAHVAYVHTSGGVDVIALVDALGKRWPLKLVEGADFYMQPTWHPEQTHIAWISWDQPQMPWDGTRLEIARVHIGAHGVRLDEARTLAGSESIAVQQPTFSPDGRQVAYVSDESGWSHVYVSDLIGGTTLQLSDGEHDHATPGWIQGLRHIAWLPDGSGVLALRQTRGVSELWCYMISGESYRVPGLEAYTSLAQISVNAAREVVVVASSSTIPPRVVILDVEGHARVVRRASAEMIPADALSTGRPVEWASLDGETVYGNYYPPASATCEGEGVPPAVMMIHGGPTAQAITAWSSKVQFFTTRGFAVLDVNYRGSTGYGREYMNALRGNWGVHDMQDAVAGVAFLGEAGLADPARVAIMGGSAGGYTVLHALVKHPGVFAAGVSMYGISNLFSLAATTHKFEAAYNDSLIGPLPEATEAYKARSPIFFVDQLSDPVAIYQGDEDNVVPPAQAEEIVESLRARGVPHTYHLYEGEGHGWRKAETIEHFYSSASEFLVQHLVRK